MFVHISAVERAGLRRLDDGQAVTYEIEQDRRTGKASATNLRHGDCDDRFTLGSADRRRGWGAKPTDFAALGIGPKIAIREDGRRTKQSGETYEWWYFDGLLDDGTVVVVWFGDNWIDGSHKRAVSVELTTLGKPIGVSPETLRSGPLTTRATNSELSALTQR